MGGEVKGRRILITLSPTEEREVKRAAKLAALPVATYVRQTVILATRAKLAEQP